MSSNFVRYSPEVETFAPNLSEYMTRIIEFWQKKARESPVTEGSGRAVRGAHAKTLGMVRAEVVMTGNAPAPYAQGIYAKPGRHDALIRSSSASKHRGPEALGPVLGFAIKIFDVGGTKLVEDEPGSATSDLVLKNSPTFIANRARLRRDPRAGYPSDLAVGTEHRALGQRSNVMPKLTAGSESDG